MKHRRVQGGRGQKVHPKRDTFGMQFVQSGREEKKRNVSSGYISVNQSVGRSVVHCRIDWDRSGGRGGGGGDGRQW